MAFLLLSRFGDCAQAPLRDRVGEGPNCFGESWRRTVAIVFAAFVIGSAFLPKAALAQRPSVSERNGNINYRAADGSTHQLTRDGNSDDPALSPDDRTVAFVHSDTSATGEGEHGSTSLWLADGPTGTMRRLVGPHPHAEPKLNFTSFEDPVFSLDGGFIYVNADAWTTSNAIHQIEVATGKRRFVIDGSVLALLRTGPYRGYLLVQRHMYYGPPNYGSYNPVYVVRPDAKEVFPVPGSENEDGAKSLGPWLKEKGWKAW